MDNEYLFADNPMTLDLLLYYCWNIYGRVDYKIILDVLEVVIVADGQQPIGEMIKRFIKYRNKTILETADAMGIRYNTFSAQLINDTLRVDTLFRLAVFLDIDLNWMHMALGYFGPVNPLARESIPRMQSEFRDEQKKYVLARLDVLIDENPQSTSDVRRALLSEFNLFFIWFE